MAVAKYSGEERKERVRFMRLRHLEAGHQSATVLNRRLDAGEFGDQGIRVTEAMLGCDSCPRAKTHKRGVSKTVARSAPNRVLHTFQGDIFFPESTTGGNRGGFRCVLKFVCEATGFRFLYFMPNKSAEECLAGLMELESWIRVHGEAVEAKHG